MRILVACEESQAVTKELRALGHEAYSNDLIPCSGGHPEWHIQKDTVSLLNDEWDMIIAFPPCTYLCVSGLHWNKRIPQRQAKTDAAIRFFMQIANAPCDLIAIENPVGCMSSIWRKPDQIINPFQFGDDASKKTCLWLKGLKKLEMGHYIHPRIVNGKKRWANQYDDGQNVVLDENGKQCGWNTAKIKKLRSKTYIGIAKAMADQWAGTATKY